MDTHNHIVCHFLRQTAVNSSPKNLTYYYSSGFTMQMIFFVTRFNVPKTKDQIH